jgi:hypothetical protein
MFVTRRPHGAKPQVKGAQELAGRAHFESVQAKTWRLRSYVGSQEHLCPGVGGNREEWPVSHVDGRSASITSKPTQLSRWKLPSTSI